MLTSKEITESLSFCEHYRNNPTRALKEYQYDRNLPEKPFHIEEDEINLTIKELDYNIKKSIDSLKKTVDNKNQQLIKIGLKTSYQVDDLLLSWTGLTHVGVYVPYLLVSSLITWLSAASAAKVQNLTVYLAQDPLTGNPCPASIYAAHSYGATILIGPSRFAFPCLAFGDGSLYEGSDLICGPCGRHLNVLKQVSALLSNKKADLFAGPSEIVIALDNLEYLPQAILDLAAQIEHGPESISYLISINCSVFDFVNEKYPSLVNRIIFHEVDTWKQATTFIEELAIETVELLGEKTALEQVVSNLTTCGIIYANVSSALGDYGVIGKGCGDPTQGTACFSSGISPWSFCRLKVVVNESYISDGLIEAGCCIAEYEKLSNHFQAINSTYLTKKNSHMALINNPIGQPVSFR